MRDLAGLWGLFKGTVNDWSGRWGRRPACRPPGPSLSPPSLLAGRHQLCRLVVFPVPLKLAHGRGNVGGLGIGVTSETVRQWGRKFGEAFSDRIRQRASARGDKWHLARSLSRSRAHEISSGALSTRRGYRRKRRRTRSIQRRAALLIRCVISEKTQPVRFSNCYRRSITSRRDQTRRFSALLLRRLGSALTS